MLLPEFVDPVMCCGDVLWTSADEECTFQRQGILHSAFKEESTSFVLLLTSTFLPGGIFISM